MSTQAYPFEESITAIRAQIPGNLANPKIGIVCGSGLSTLASRFKDKHEVPYHGLPGFVESTVAGHKSAFAFGRLGEGVGIPVVAMLGRVSISCDCRLEHQVGLDLSGDYSSIPTRGIRWERLLTLSE